jgi:photosystem II stability/assembly factor-like uncharacterized protein
MKKRITALAGILSLTIIISGCSSSKDAKAEAKNIEKGFKAEHLHGIAYAEDDNIYVATHEGMLTTGKDGGKWSLKGSYDFDFMGFNVMSDGTMITSGHPGKLSDLPNPLGLMVSENNGEEWKSKSMLGKVDFHILSSNFSNSKVIYGVNQMDSGRYKAGIYVSTDKGKEWEIVDSVGLPEDLHQIYSLISMPDDEKSLMAGTQVGVLRSSDGGKTWKVADSSRLITAISVLPVTKDLISYSITNNEVGIMISKDQGESWENLGNDLGRDAVAYFGVNPKDSNKIAISTFENTVMTTEDGGNNWTTIMDKGIVQ